MFPCANVHYGDTGFSLSYEACNSGKKHLDRTQFLMILARE